MKQMIFTLQFLVISGANLNAIVVNLFVCQQICYICIRKNSTQKVSIQVWLQTLRDETHYHVKLWYVESTKKYFMLTGNCKTKIKSKTKRAEHSKHT